MGLSREPGLVTRLTADTHITLFNNAGALGFFFFGLGLGLVQLLGKSCVFFFLCFGLG